MMSFHVTEGNTCGGARWRGERENLLLISTNTTSEKWFKNSKVRGLRRVTNGNNTSIATGELGKVSKKGFTSAATRVST